VLRRDYPVAQLLSLLLVFKVGLTNLRVDIAYRLVDPRIRHT
jgi:ABC-type dipeptide/oligopeptide/nickel transport system permease component